MQNDLCLRGWDTCFRASLVSSSPNNWDMFPQKLFTSFSSRLVQSLILKKGHMISIPISRICFLASFMLSWPWSDSLLKIDLRIGHQTMKNMYPCINENYIHFRFHFHRCKNQIPWLFLVQAHWLCSDSRSTFHIYLLVGIARGRQ